jgi:predicted PurR-regulated permease PerM
LRDWGKLTAVVDQLIPRRHYAVIREQMAAIDETLSGFVRGQAIVCVCLGVIYSTGLALNGLKYGATVGIIAGVLTIIPYVGTVFGWLTSVVLAAVQFSGDWLHIGLVVAVFVVGHLLEAYVLTPKLVGHRVGLHPIWILFALIAGVKLMGFTGVLIAVPTAAVIGVLVRFAVRQYKESTLYK